MNSKKCRRRKRWYGIALLGTSGTIIATAVVARFSAPGTGVPWTVAVVSSLNLPTPSTRDARIRTLFADEMGYPKSTPRDSVQIRVERWRPRILNSPFAPEWHEFESVQLTMFHNGLGERVTDWTELEGREVRRLLRQSRQKLVGLFNDDRFERGTYNVWDVGRFLETAASGGPLTKRQFQIIWGNIPLNICFAAMQPWCSGLLGVMLGVGSMLLIGSREPRAGRCSTCAYDLRGLPIGAVCPECGTAAAASTR